MIIIWSFFKIWWNYFFLYKYKFRRNFHADSGNFFSKLYSIFWSRDSFFSTSAHISVAMFFTLKLLHDKTCKIIIIERFFTVSIYFWDCFAKNCLKTDFHQNLSPVVKYIDIEISSAPVGKTGFRAKNVVFGTFSSKFVLMYTEPTKTCTKIVVNTLMN